MRVLIVEHHDKPTGGVIGETLRDLGVEMDTLWGASGDAMPAATTELSSWVGRWRRPTTGSAHISPL